MAPCLRGENAPGEILLICDAARFVLRDGRYDYSPADLPLLRAGAALLVKTLKGLR